MPFTSMANWSIRFSIQMVCVLSLSLSLTGPVIQSDHRIVSVLTVDLLANMFNLNTQMMSKEPNHVTMRTLGGDGNYESTDSDKVFFLAQQTSQEDDGVKV